MSLRLLGIGTATPPHAIGQRDAASMAASFQAASTTAPQTLAALYRTTRIRSRGSVLLEEPVDGGFRQSFFAPAGAADDKGPSTRSRLVRYEAEAPRLAADAASRGLEAAGVRAGQVSHLVTCSCTGFSSPGVDLALVEKLGLPAEVSRTHVGFMGCHAGFNALRVAAALGGSAGEGIVLTVAVELCSLHFQYGDRGDMIVANAIFADGAGAIVGCHRPSDHGLDEAHHRWQLSHQASAVLPDSGDCMGWQIGNHGFEMRLSPRVPQVIAEHLGGIVDRELSRIGLARNDVGSWAVHPGGPRVLSCVEEALGLAPSALTASREVLASYGNMSSATMFFILERLRQQSAPLPCVALAFGPGLTCELAVFTAAPR
jgi:predicted naringenin-chalcone synthase